MIPRGRRKMSKKQMQKMMKQMGLKEIPDVTEVIIRLVDKEIVISDAQVTRMSASGQEVYQIVGEGEERTLSEEIETEKGPEILEEDVHLVAQQAGVSIEAARNALIEAEGDLAKAILSLKTLKR